MFVSLISDRFLHVQYFVLLISVDSSTSRTLSSHDGQSTNMNCTRISLSIST